MTRSRRTERRLRMTECSPVRTFRFHIPFHVEVVTGWLSATRRANRRSRERNAELDRNHSRCW
jgi:hypothetical protein